jgi:hypothetical protein
MFPTRLPLTWLRYRLKVFVDVLWQIFVEVDVLILENVGGLLYAAQVVEVEPPSGSPKTGGCFELYYKDHSDQHLLCPLGASSMGKLLMDDTPPLGWWAFRRWA